MLTEMNVRLINVAKGPVVRERNLQRRAGIEVIQAVHSTKTLLHKEGNGPVI